VERSQPINRMSLRFTLVVRVAKSIVQEKVRQSLNLLAELHKYHGEVRALTVRDIGSIKKDHENLLMYEGNSAILYWSEPRKVFNKLYPEFRFTDRNGRRHSWNTNASDEVNALLNYGYAVLESEVRKDLNSIGLDPSISFLHELSNSRASLVYDAQELYRWLVDLSMIQLLGEKRYKKADFIVTENYNIKQGKAQLRH
jgi:CRISPR-associated protein Cas1